MKKWLGRLFLTGAAGIAALLGWCTLRTPEIKVPGPTAVIDQPSGDIVTEPSETGIAAIDSEPPSDPATPEAVLADPKTDAPATGNQTSPVQPVDEEALAQTPSDDPQSPAAARDDEPVADDPQRPAAARDDEPNAGDPQRPAAVSDDEPVADPTIPRFDIVRVDADGQTVIAGNAAPDARVEVLLDGEVVGQATTDADGAFVAVIFANLSGEAQQLQLRTLAPPLQAPQPVAEPGDVATEPSLAPTASVDQTVPPAQYHAPAGSETSTAAAQPGIIDTRSPVQGGEPEQTTTRTDPGNTLGVNSTPTQTAPAQTTPLAGQVEPDAAVAAGQSSEVAGQTASESAAPNAGQTTAPPAPAAVEPAATRTPVAAKQDTETETETAQQGAEIAATGGNQPSATQTEPGQTAAATGQTPAGDDDASRPVEQTAEPSVPTVIAAAPSVPTLDTGASVASPSSQGPASVAVGSTDTLALPRTGGAVLSPGAGGASLPGAAPLSNEAAAPAATGQQFVLSAPVIILPSAEPDASPTLVQPQADALEVLQPSHSTGGGVVLDRISYGDGGEVVLSGRATPGRAVRIYGNATLLETIRPDDTGAWSWSLPVDQAAGISLFRLDQIDAQGGVESRVETPFDYSVTTPKVLREREVVIQKGDYLWRIAEQYYGEGLRFSLIYGANEALIRDPDLIYPGQVFSIPELVDAQ